MEPKFKVGQDVLFVDPQSDDWGEPEIGKVTRIWAVQAAMPGLAAQGCRYSVDFQGIHGAGDKYNYPEALLAPLTSHFLARNVGVWAIEGTIHALQLRLVARCPDLVMAIWLAAELNASLPSLPPKLKEAA